MTTLEEAHKEMLKILESAAYAYGKDTCYKYTADIVGRLCAVRDCCLVSGVDIEVIDQTENDGALRAFKEVLRLECGLEEGCEEEIAELARFTQAQKNQREEIRERRAARAAKSK